MGIFLIITLSQTGFTWWDTAHMLTVQVAKSQLTPPVQKKIQDVISYFEEDFPNCNTLLTASCFPDDMTSLGLSGFKVWHGVLKPYDPDNILSEREINIIETLVSTNNLHSAINQSLKTLKNPNASEWEQSFMLCFLLHCVSDIHQPLHCIQLYSNQFPDGDMAGHRFHLKDSKFKNLHTLWDSMLGLGSLQMTRPLDEKNEAWLTSFAEDIINCYPPEALPEHLDMSITNWSQESYDIAVSCVYDGIEPDITPSSEYIKRGQEVAKRQIALAGYRLANLLNKLYEKR
ncbi:MAG: hypothetical protein S4CHLAM45_14320 [Chlamydiales bacterium]|nr:hypothetical protein [Chlamydiales bacterium]MCH9620059.1 hypothetical protein [Chlamydiales bacterium]MCH9623522.1 hypothetical protein [Chlamydiales bacterium]